VGSRSYTVFNNAASTTEVMQWRMMDVTMTLEKYEGVYLII